MKFFIEKCFKWPGKIGISTIFLFLFLGIGQADAIEVYTLVDQACRQETGLIIDTTRDEVGLLTVEGKYARWKRKEVRSLLVYNLLNNPISKLEMRGPLARRIRSIQLSGKEGLQFSGWPIRFFEDLIVFYDIEGKTHIQEIERIRRVSKPKGINENIPIETYTITIFSTGNALPECTNINHIKGTAFPTRVLGDQIKIGKFFSDYQDGFERLNRFEKRTIFYARPFLFDAPTQMGITLSEERYQYRKELIQSFPFSIQWSNGSSYGPQAFFRLGSNHSEILPNVEPVFALRTDIKAHLFTASFIGNPMAMAQGADFIVKNRFQFQEYFARIGPGDTVLVPHFNQMALTGLEWGAHSVSMGFFHPILGIHGINIFREVLFPNPTLIGRYLYTTEHSSYRLLYAAPRHGSDHPTPQDIRLATHTDMLLPGILSQESAFLQSGIQWFSVGSDFIRAGVNLDLNKELEFRVDGVVLSGTYHEWLRARYYRLDFQHYVVSTGFIQRFGERVALVGDLNYFQRQYQTESREYNGSRISRRFSLVGTIRFAL